VSSGTKIATGKRVLNRRVPPHSFFGFLHGTKVTYGLHTNSYVKMKISMIIITYFIHLIFLNKKGVHTDHFSQMMDTSFPFF